MKRVPVWVGFMAVGLALITGVATFAVLTGLTPIVPNHTIVVVALLANGIMVLALLGLIIQEIYLLMRERRRQSAASRLHVRVVGFFSAMAAFPAILVAIVASITLEQGLDRWFSARTQAIVNTSSNVAQVYVREKGQQLKSDMLALSRELAKAQPLFELDKERYESFLSSQALSRGLTTLAILQQDLSELARASGIGIAPPKQQILPPPEAIFKAETGDIILIAPGETNQVGGLLKLQWQGGVYLYVSRAIEPHVVNAIRDVEAASQEYRALEQRRAGVQLAFALMYVTIALIVLLSAVWVGLHFANRMVSPIRRLMYASDQVARGNFYVSVPINEQDGDLAALGRSFNVMTAELRQQNDDLLTATRTMDQRRRFTEAVLSGVPVGVIGLDLFHTITLINKSALSVLGLDEQEPIIKKPIAEVVPELTIILHEISNGKAYAQGEIQLTVRGLERTLIARVSADPSEDTPSTLVVTLDDITDLVTAQRMSAWGDVARRIAHEIKNPLTPIQLSAERLRRKYGKLIIDDREVFDQCIDTIVRQVGDIGRMVDEFSSFARMPKPVMARENLSEAVRQSVFLARVGYSNIAFSQDLPPEPVMAFIDRRLISQALTNLLKNAAEAIDGMETPPADGSRVHIELRADHTHATIHIFDNGPGFPVEGRERLLEPYMTTREKGTGLGLAIVKRIFEEHHGDIKLLDAVTLWPEAQSGALVSIHLPLSAVISSEIGG